MNNDFTIENRLQNLSQKLRTQIYWGSLPEETKWDCLELGDYILPISLPQLLSELNCRKNCLTFRKTTTEIFDQHEELYGINQTPSDFIIKIENLISSDSLAEFRNRLTAVLKTEVYFISED